MPRDNVEWWELFLDIDVSKSYLVLSIGVDEGGSCRSLGNPLQGHSPGVIPAG